MYGETPLNVPLRRRASWAVQGTRTFCRDMNLCTAYKNCRPHVMIMRGGPSCGSRLVKDCRSGYCGCRTAVWEATDSLPWDVCSPAEFCRAALMEKMSPFLLHRAGKILRGVPKKIGGVRHLFSGWRVFQTGLAHQFQGPSRAERFPVSPRENWEKHAPENV